MFQTEVNAQSPLRILESSLKGGLAPGQLGVVLARPGVGKTALLVQVGLDNLMRGRKVLHVDFGAHTIERVELWYDTLFDDLAAYNHLDDPNEARAVILNNRIIQIFANTKASSASLGEVISLYSEHMSFKPDVIIIDGFDWGRSSKVMTAAAVSAFKTHAKVVGAELWMGGRVSRGPGGLASISPCEPYLPLMDATLLLRQKGNSVALHLIKEEENTNSNVVLYLHPDTMRLLRPESIKTSVGLPPTFCTLLSGGSAGAEKIFGETAEKWDVKEIHYTFEGQPVARDKRLVVLNEAQLREGDFNIEEVRERVACNVPDTPLFRKVLQTIWHEVHGAHQVFIVGVIMEDNSIKGGTGWAAELAKDWKKILHTYDQERRGWFTWKNGAWESDEAPVIRARRFTGTGTRHLSEAGKAAIIDLFERSFGQE